MDEEKKEEGGTKVAVITGSATGVGAATAEKLSALGWHVVINYSKSEAEAKQTFARCEKLGPGALLVQGDVSDDTACQRMVQVCLDRWGRLDALVNNAGTTKFCAFDDLDGLDMEDFQHLYAVNVVGAYQMTRAAAGALKSANGVIVNNASIAALTGVGSSIAYAASKGALVTMTLSLAQALAPQIRVNCVCPGFIQGRWTKGFLGDRYHQVKTTIEQSAALQKTATPADVAENIVFFVTSANLVTGQILIVDGGSTLKQVTLGRK